MIELPVGEKVNKKLFLIRVRVLFPVETALENYKVVLIHFAIIGYGTIRERLF